MNVLYAALVNGRLARQTIAITGAEQLYLSDAARRVAAVLGRRILRVPAPLWFHYALGVGLRGYDEGAAGGEGAGLYPVGGEWV